MFAVQIFLIQYSYLDNQPSAVIREVVGRMSTLLVFVGNIHVARHVDIDGIGRELANASDDDLYLQTVNSARILVRTLEAAMQSLYDDGSMLLLTAQAMRSSPSRQEDSASRDTLSAVATCMQANLNVVLQTLEALLGVGLDQAHLSQGDYDGSIGWRMSRLSLTPTLQSDRTHRPGSSISVVDMALALTPSSRPLKGPIKSFEDRSTLNGNDTPSMSTMVDRPSETASDRDTDSLDDQGQSLNLRYDPRLTRFVVL